MAFFQTDNLWVQDLDGIAVVLLDVPGSKTNALGRAVLANLAEALERIEANARFRLLVVRSAKAHHFGAGLAVAELAALKEASEFHDLAEQGQRVCARLEAFRLPSVAVIAGACRGGALELALACDFRVVVDRPGVHFGFGELELGLCPSWGGTQRLPHLVGLERSVTMLLGNRTLGPREALEWGLADALSEGAQEQAPDVLAHPVKKARPFLPYRTLRQKLLESTRLGRRLLLHGAESWLRRRAIADMPAHAETLTVLRRGLLEGADVGLACERDALARLSQSDAFRHLLRLQIGNEELRQRWRAANGQRPVARVGVVGTGPWASSLIHLVVSHGLEVTVQEKAETELGLAMFRMLALFQQDIEQGGLSMEAVKKHLARIHGTTSWKGFNNLDVIFETTGATVDRVRPVLTELEEHAGADAVLATSAKTCTIGVLQEGLANPQRLAGFHVLPRSAAIEVVRGALTHEAAIQDLAAAVVALGRTPIVQADRPGLLVHRILFAGTAEAVQLVKEGMQPELIDAALRRFGMAWGPLEWADLLGLDTAAELAQGLTNTWSARGITTHDFGALVAKGWLGLKNQLGFYRYRRGRARRHSSLRNYLRQRGWEEDGHPAEPLSRKDQARLAEKRIVGLMVNEACWCLHDKIVASAEEVDLALTLSGWAPHRGGPFTHVQSQGIDDVVDRLNDLAGQYGPRFQACPAWSVTGHST